jgi:hypothetical protein
VTAVRILLLIALLANLGVVAVTHHVCNTSLRYEVGKGQALIRQQTLRNRVLLLRVAEQRRASNLVRRAGDIGIKVRPIESNSLRLAQRR